MKKEPRWNLAQRERWRRGLEELKTYGLRIGSAKLRFDRIRQEDWAESWKKHFKPFEIGRRLLVRPSWSRRRARRGQAVVELDPGLSFGTGQHPTTAYCLRQLVSRRRPDEPQSFLDLGTGSGILAIAAAKLGYAPIEALDFDTEAIRIARANACANQVEKLIRFQRQDLSKLRGGGNRYSVVCANLTADLLRRERNRILARLEPKGVLVLAGILDREFAEVQDEFEAARLRLVSSCREKEWRSGTFA